MKLVHFYVAAAVAITSAVRADESSVLLTAFDEALPRTLLDKLSEECEKVHKWATDPAATSSLMHGKRPTFWYDMTNKPRNNIEAAVLKLRELVPSNMIANNDTSSVMGAEWWVQIRAGSGSDVAAASIGFHYDKDEGTASLKGKMLFPLVSTVTYLTSTGAPTLIFNMTTNENGNVEVPPIPDQGYLSYPKVNRHILFGGNLQHGVLGSAAPKLVSKRSKNKRRITLLINWWSAAPIEPNTVVLTDELAASMGLLLAPEDIVQDDASGSSAQISTTGEVEQSSQVQARIVPAVLLEIPERSLNTAVRHQVEFPPGDMQFMYLPPEIEKEGVYKIQWGADQVYGAVGLLDLFNQNQVSQLFQMPQPKLMILLDHTNLPLYEKMLQVALPLAKDLVGKMKFYFCLTDKCAGVLEAFGLSAKDLPRAVIDDTAGVQKYIQNKSDWQPTRESLEALISTTPFSSLVVRESV